MGGKVLPFGQLAACGLDCRGCIHRLLERQGSERLGVPAEPCDHLQTNPAAGLASNVPPRDNQGMYWIASLLPTLIRMHYFHLGLLDLEDTAALRQPLQYENGSTHRSSSGCVIEVAGLRAASGWRAVSLVGRPLDRLPSEALECHANSVASGAPPHPGPRVDASLPWGRSSPRRSLASVASMMSSQPTPLRMLLRVLEFMKRKVIWLFAGTKEPPKVGHTSQALSKN